MMPFDLLQFVSLPISLLLIFLIVSSILITRTVNRLPEQWIVGFVRTNRFTYLVTGLTVLLTLILLGSSSYLLTQERERTFKEAYSDLQSVREGVEASLTAWIDDRKSYIESIARDRELSDSIVRLLALDAESDAILASNELREIRNFFQERMEQFGDLGFFVISPQGISLASMRDENIGSLNLIKVHRPDLFALAMSGESQFIPPIPSDVKLPSRPETATHLKNLSMFFLTPVSNEQGEVIALISQRLDPTTRLSEILMLGRLGDSGESYLLDKQGVMLTKSRFDNSHIQKQLNEEGLFEVRVPDRTLGASATPTLIAQRMLELGNIEQPTSEIVRFTVESPYPDYRGVTVIGVGAWSSLLQVGIVSEIDEAEFLRQFNQTATTFGISLITALFVAVTITTLTIVFSSRASRILQRTASELENRVADRTIWLANIIDNAADGIIVIDSVGTVREFNPSAERIFGYDKSELIGKNLNVLMPEPMSTEHDSYLWHYATTGNKRMIGNVRETLGRHKSGKVFEIDLAISESVLDGEKVFTGLVRDISVRKQAERELVSAKLEAEQATIAKSEFLANMSHEIRTPMNAIIGMSELALQMELAPKQRHYIEKVNNSAESLLGIINDILDFSKIEAGKITLELREFALDDLLDELADVIGMQAEEKGVELLFDIPASTKAHFIGDSLRLKQILLNLGSNAVKFTKQGEVVIKLTTQMVNDEKIALDIEVRDSGIGMTDEQASRLFQPFNQADNSITRSHGGTGLGLVICRSLVSLMDGEINLTSKLGEGTVVKAKVLLGRSNTTAKHLEMPHFENLRALVVDDNLTSNRILADLLVRLGIIATTTSSSSEALKYLDQSQDNGLTYDLLFVDWRMPEMDGIELINHLERIPSIKPKQIYMLSAAMPEDVKAAAQGLKHSGVLQKPLNASRLYDALANSFKPGHGANRSRGSERHAEQLALAREKIAGAHLLVVEDNAINQEITLELLQRAGVSAVVANNGAEALTLIESDEFDAVLMDIQMPIMDGYTATREIRAHDKYAEIPIIAMTANAMQSDVEKAICAGMNAHIAKPIDIQGMYSTLIDWVKPRAPLTSGSQNVAGTQGDETAQQTLPDLHDLDTIGALERLGGNESAYLQLLLRFSRNYNSFEDQLTEALSSDDGSIAIRLVHTLKGLSGSIGDLKLNQVAAQAQNQLELGHLEPAIQQKLLDLVKIRVMLLETVDPNDASLADGCEVDSLEQLQQLDQLLAEDSGDAVDLVRQLIKNHYPPILQTTLITLQERVEEYEFVEARAILASVLPELGKKDD